MTQEQRENALKVLKGCHIKEPHKNINSRTVSSIKEGSEKEVKHKKSLFFSCENKKRYKTQSEATRVSNFFKNRNDRDWTRVYYCNYCGFYHLTSKPLIPSKTKKINLNRKHKKCKMKMKKDM